MSSGVVGVLALPRRISSQIMADLSDRLFGEWVYYDDAVNTVMRDSRLLIRHM